jgi:hypothetical protein
MEHCTNGRQQRRILLGRIGGPLCWSREIGPRVPLFYRP